MHRLSGQSNGCILVQYHPDIIKLFMLHSNSHKILTAHENENDKNKYIIALGLSYDVLILFINVKMTTVGIIMFVSRINFMLG